MIKLGKYIATGLLLCAAACSTDDALHTPDAPEQAPEAAIGFTATAPTPDTRMAADFVDATKFDAVGSQFIVFADYRYNKIEKTTDMTDADYNALLKKYPSGYRDSISVFKNQVVTSVGAGNVWSYSPVQYWNPTGAYDFRAVWPTSADILSTSNGQAIAVSYSMFDSADNNDIMVAYKRRTMPHTDEGNVVGLKFRHALCAVNVVLVKGDEVTDEILVEKTWFRNLYSVGVLVFTGNETSDLTKQWRLVYKDDVSNLHEYPVTAYVTPYQLKKRAEYDTDNDNNLTDEELLVDKNQQGFVFMLPQDINTPVNNVLPADEELAKFCFKIFTGTTAPTTNDKGETVDVTTYTDPIDEEVNLPQIKWEAGKKYTYVLTVKPSERTEVTVVTTQWDPVQAMGDDIVINSGE